ncbi:hypothetical protein PI125_g27104 [Phytophthora idaei]|nr:hypothetical protein PI125_g27104 [Phytophthora idaei]
MNASLVLLGQRVLPVSFVSVVGVEPAALAADAELWWRLLPRWRAPGAVVHVHGDGDVVAVPVVFRGRPAAAAAGRAALKELHAHASRRCKFLGRSCVHVVLRVGASSSANNRGSSGCRSWSNSGSCCWA